MVYEEAVKRRYVQDESLNYLLLMDRKKKRKSKERCGRLHLNRRLRTTFSPIELKFKIKRRVLLVICLFEGLSPRR